MNRIALAVALTIAAVTGLVFGLYPDLDLKVSALFFGSRGFAAADAPTLVVLREVAMIIVGLLLAPALAAVFVKLIRPEHRMFVPGRAALFLLVTIVLGPLLVTNIALKDNWARPRPRDVAAFGGTENFLPWWDPRGACDVNCSFIAGEASGAFWTVAPASLAPPQWRPLAYAGALAFGAAVGVMRLSFGGHFFSDVVFAGVITFVIIWLVHGFIFRWPRTRFSDAAVESRLGRFAFALRRVFRGTRSSTAPHSKPGFPLARE